MAYFYQVSFNISSDDMTELEIGSTLERVIGYLKTLLPSEPGYHRCPCILLSRQR